MIPTARPGSFFLITLICICLTYLGITHFYNHYVMLSVDEFWFAHRIYEYKSGLPYRDFAPYKTILGYYLILPAMLSARGIMQTLLFTKDAFALLNMFILFISSLWLTRFFSRASVLTSLAVLISSELVISYSTQLRVDLPGYWLGFFALLLLLEKRYLLAGLLLGLGFITTQKIIWYLLASNAAMVVQNIFCDQRLKIKPIMIFNLAFAAIVALYLTFWSMIADWHTVIHSVFYEASAMYQLNWYDASRKLFWQTITLCNPLLFLLWPLSLFSLFISYDKDRNYSSRLFVVTFALVIMLCLVPYKQVFPYYMQVTIPVFLILYAAVIHWVHEIFKHEPRLMIKPFYLWIMLAVYLALIAFFILSFNLPKPYLLISIIPIALMVCVTTRKMEMHSFRIIMITGFFMGFIYPLSLLPTKMVWLNGAYQQAHINTINSLLEEGGDYVAGIELIYNKTQPIAGLRHLMGPAISYLYTPSPRLREVMLASLYEDPDATQESIVHDLINAPVKFYVNNYRMNALPITIKKFLDSEYEHWWGSIYIYAPKIAEKKQIILLKFTGKYQIESAHPVYLNAKQYAPDSMVILQKGKLVAKSTRAFRLKLIPAFLPHHGDFQMDTWEKLMF